MEKSLAKLKAGYAAFREKYAAGDASTLEYLADHGQKPEVMVVGCCDSRVDPALILQCDPGDLFVTRNVANIIPPYEKDASHHGTSAALEFAIRFLQVKHLVILGHSQCGGIQALLEGNAAQGDDFISSWVSLVKRGADPYPSHQDDCAKEALKRSYENCLTFPWVRAAVQEGRLAIHLWFFNIKTGEIFVYCHHTKAYHPL